MPQSTEVLRDLILKYISLAGVQLQSLPASQQKAIVNSATNDARYMIRALAAEIAAGGKDRTAVTVDWFKIANRIEAKVSAEANEKTVAKLMQFKGRSAVLVFVDPGEFDVVQREVEVMDDVRRMASAGAPLIHPEAAKPIVLTPTPIEELVNRTPAEQPAERLVPRLDPEPPAARDPNEPNSYDPEADTDAAG